VRAPARPRRFADRAQNAAKPVQTGACRAQNAAKPVQTGACRAQKRAKTRMWHAETRAL